MLTELYWHTACTLLTLWNITVSSFCTDTLSKTSVTEAWANKNKTAKSSYVRPSCWIPNVKWLLHHTLYFKWLVLSRLLWNVDTYLSKRHHIVHCDNLKLCAFSFVLEFLCRLWPSHLPIAGSVVNYRVWNVIRGTSHTLHVYTLSIPICVSETAAVPITTVAYRRSAA